MKKGLIIVAAFLLLAWVAVWAADVGTDFRMSTTANNSTAMRRFKDGNFPLPLTGLARSMPGDSACTSSAFNIAMFTKFTTCWDADSLVYASGTEDDSIFLGIHFQISMDASNWVAWDSAHDTTGGAKYLANRCKVWTTNPVAPYGRFIFSGLTRTRAAVGIESTQSDSIVLSKVYHTFQQ